MSENTPTHGCFNINSIVSHQTIHNLFIFTIQPINDISKNTLII